MNKELLKQRFRRRIHSYNENAKIQRQMAAKIVNFLSEVSFDSVLELGCGTGFLTEMVVDKINFEHYTAIDIVSECEPIIKKINPKIDFVANDIEYYMKNTNKKFDLIISNASLQWVENFEELVKSAISKLNSHGIFLFSTFGTENFREIYHVLGKTLKYFSTSELRKCLSEYNPIIEEEIRIMAFKTPIDVLKHIQSTGVNAIISEAWTKKDLADFERVFNTFCAYRPTLTYHPIYVLIKINHNS